MLCLEHWLTHMWSECKNAASVVHKGLLHGLQVWQRNTDHGAELSS